MHNYYNIISNVLLVLLLGFVNINIFSTNLNKANNLEENVIPWLMHRWRETEREKGHLIGFLLIMSLPVEKEHRI